MNYKLNILVVDDDPALLEQAELILDSQYQVSLAVSGTQALNYLQREGGVDLILLDILMPEMNGYETLAAIRNIPGYEQIPVIFLTSLTGADAELQGLAAGAADYITKPFDSRILHARIQMRLQTGYQLDDQKLENLPSPLTDSEWKVAKLLAKLYTNEEICRELHYALPTVKKMVSHILDKLQIKNRREIKEYLK